MKIVILYIFVLGNVNLSYFICLVMISPNSYLAIPLCQRFPVSLLFFNNIFLVVEIDLPWDSNAVETHGINFTAWREEQFKRLTKTLTTNLVNPFAFVVVILLERIL